MKFCLLFLTFCVASIHAIAQEEVEVNVIDVIKKHGLEQSEVMDIASWITDVYGPRLTGSPMLDEATDWARHYLVSMGMENVHLHEWGPFGRGWELEHFEMHVEEPGYWPVLAWPKAWSSSAKGKGTLIYIDAHTEEELMTYQGRLKGQIVMMDTIRELKERFEPLAERHDAESLLRLSNAGPPTPRPRRGWRNMGGFNFNRAMWELINEEQPLVVLDRSYKGDYGTIFVQGARTQDGRRQNIDVDVVPQVTLAVEHYNRLFRMLNKGIEPKLSIDLKTQYTNKDGMEHNIIAEIPGTDLAEEVVMFGAHFDSWQSATGATDNGAGSAVMMEVARILLKTIEETGERPRRTLRLALWTGEEQGLLGSRAYVGDHFADFGESTWTPQALKPAQEKISAYYNMDNGCGKIRGVYMQGNEDVRPVFREYLDVLDMDGVETLTLRNTGSTDHVPFHGVGIPAFQFIQDGISYGTRSHHSSMDFYDHLIEDDLKSAATVVATFVWLTSQRDEKLPRREMDIEEAEER